MKTLIILALLALISFNSSQPSTSDISTMLFKCPDDKIKIGEDVCAFKSYDSTITKNVYYIKKKSCGKNKKCEFINQKYNKDTSTTLLTQNDYIYTCQKKIKYLKIDKKCNYNAECYSGFCNIKNKKCAAYGEEKCSNNENCGAGKYCSSSKCYDYKKEGESCKTNYCAPWLWCDTSTSDPTCKKFYSLDTGKTCSIDKQCKSYLCGGTCLEIVSVDSNCQVKYTDGTNEVTFDGKTTSTYDGKEVCAYPSGYKDLVEDVVERYNKIKFDKVYEKEYCDYETFYCDKKYAELYSVLNQYHHLLHQGLIKENGKKNGDNKCEYEFWRSTISSSYTNVCFGFALALLGLLF